MLEEILELINNNDEKGLTEYISDNYDEIGEYVFTLCVAAAEMNDDAIEKFAIIIKALVEHGHNLDFTDNNGTHALFAAIKAQKLMLVVAFGDLDELFFQENNMQLSPIAYAYTLDNEEIQLYCTNKLGEHVNDRICMQGDFMTYLSLALCNCSLDICKIITENEFFDFHQHEIYIDEIEWDDTPEDQEKQDFLMELKYGRDDEEYEEDEENEEEDSKLEEMKSGLTQLMYAVAQDNYEEVKSLIEQGAKINHRNTAGFTPLMIAVFKDNYDIAEYLIEQGAYINTRVYNGLTPIIKTYLGSKMEMFELLLDNSDFVDKYSYDFITKREPIDDIQIEMKKIIKDKKVEDIENDYPFEYMYQLGYNETLDDDGYHGVKDVFSEWYGTNMINSFSYCNAYGASPIINEKEKKEEKNVKGVMTRGPKDLFKESCFAVLFEDGTVVKYGVDGKEKGNIFKKEKIVQIESTNYSIVGLTEDGRVLIDDNILDELNDVKEWKNIKKIAAGNSSIFGITSDGEFKCVISKIDSGILEGLFEGWSKEKAVDIAACNFKVGIVLDDGRVLVNYNEELIDYITDAIGISINEHTVILRDNKTVYAYGNNNYKQCNVAKWHDIERVQATHFNTVGYATNGEILSTECMFMSKNIDRPIPIVPTKPEGFGNLISMSLGGITPDAITFERSNE